MCAACDSSALWIFIQKTFYVNSKKRNDVKHDVSASNSDAERSTPKPRLRFQNEKIPLLVSLQAHFCVNEYGSAF